MFNQGDIVLVSFPFTDLKQGKVRPAVVLSNNKINRTSDLIMAAITSVIRDDEFSFLLSKDLLIKPLEKDSEVRINKIFTVEKAIVKATISSIKAPKVQELINKIVSCMEYEKN